MSIKRRRDRAGLLGDVVTVMLGDGATAQAEIDAVNELLQYNSPRSRIERLREYDDLVEIADRLMQRLEGLGGKSDYALDALIASAETMALYRRVEQRDKQRRSRGGQGRAQPAVATPVHRLRA